MAKSVLLFIVLTSTITAIRAHSIPLFTYKIGDITVGGPAHTMPHYSGPAYAHIMNEYIKKYYSSAKLPPIYLNVDYTASDKVLLSYDTFEGRLLEVESYGINGEAAIPGIRMYRIKKITSKNSWYIIYAEKQDSIYKIVVAKEKRSSADCQKVVVGKYYDLELKSRRENVPMINGIKLKPANYLDVKSSSYDKQGIECYAYDKETEICIDPKKGIYDLYYTNDLKGLCYLK